LWRILKEKARSKLRPNIESLKADFVNATVIILLKEMHAGIDEWPDRLKKCVNVKVGYFK